MTGDTPEAHAKRVIRDESPHAGEKGVPFSVVIYELTHTGMPYVAARSAIDALERAGEIYECGDSRYRLTDAAKADDFPTDELRELERP